MGAIDIHLNLPVATPGAMKDIGDVNLIIYVIEHSISKTLLF